MNKHFLRFIQFSLIIAISGWFIGGTIQSAPVAAQGSDLDAILARAVVKGYFISLKRGTSGSPTLESFYLTEAAADSEIALKLNEMGVAAYKINDEMPQDGGGYKITATLEPENYILTADVNKITNRWQISSLAWIEGPTETTMADDAATATEPGTDSVSEDTPAVDGAANPATAADEISSDTVAATETTPESDATSTAVDSAGTPVAEVISGALNVRTGPGFEFDVASTLKQGDVVDILGTRVTDDRPWYQIAQNSTTLGWISAKPQYVVASGNTDSIPTVSLDSVSEETATPAEETATPLETPAETLANAEEDAPEDTTSEETNSEPATTEEAPTDTSVSGEKPTAEVLSVALNVRTGPGFEYEVVARLRQGEIVEVIGTNVTDNRPWYQITRDGSPLGWISAKSPYVRSAGDLDSIPTVPAPEISSSNNETSSVVIPAAATISASPVTGQKLILQNRSGGEIYLVNSARTDARLLTSGIDPALSPDGTKLAFTRWGSGGEGSVWIYDFNTGAEEQIMGESLQAKSPTWSPDGSQIMISFQEGGRREVEEKCHKLGERKVPRGAYDINIGSESRRICYKLQPDTHWRLRKIDVGARTYQDMASDIYSRSPSWDPAESWRVVFAGDKGLKQLDVNRNVILPMFADPRDQDPRISPDGSQIAVTYSQHQHWEVYTLSIPEGNRSRLTKISILDDTYNSAAPAWSPDGSQIAFITDRTGQWEYWIMNADGSNPRPLLPASVSAKIAPEYNSVDERLITWGR